MGAWIEIAISSWCLDNCTVAPLVGAWIEICSRMIYESNVPSSLPLWERGLKCTGVWCGYWIVKVAPLVGAWIEISHPLNAVMRSSVAPLVGAWIEIADMTCARFITLSLPLWERGLKFLNFKDVIPQRSRSPCGSVD